MPVDTQQIMDAAEKLGQLVAQHPSVAKYKQAQKSLGEDPDAARLLADFNRQLETLVRQEQQGQPVTDAQRNQLEGLQRQISSHLRIKNLNMAEVEFVDILRRVSQAIRAQVVDRPAAGAPAPAAPAGPRLAQ